MKISRLIKELEEIKADEGDIEVVMTATVLHEGYKRDNLFLEDVFPSTVETLKVCDPDNTFSYKYVKLFWQM